jgi:hypothetical protein
MHNSLAGFGSRHMSSWSYRSSPTVLADKNTDLLHGLSYVVLEPVRQHVIRNDIRNQHGSGAGQ